MMVASRIERSKSRAMSGKELQGLSAGAKTPGRGGRGCVKAGVGSLSSDMLPLRSWQKCPGTDCGTGKRPRLATCICPKMAVSSPGKKAGGQGGPSQNSQELEELAGTPSILQQRPQPRSHVAWVPFPATHSAPSLCP